MENERTAAEVVAMYLSRKQREQEQEQETNALLAIIRTLQQERDEARVWARHYRALFGDDPHSTAPAEEDPDWLLEERSSEVPSEARREDRASETENEHAKGRGDGTINR